MRYAIRTFLKTPGFTAIAIVTIALGIAANTAIFSVVNGVLLRPLPFDDEARVVELTTRTANEAQSSYSAGEFTDVRQSARTLEAIAGFREDVTSVAIDRGEPAQMDTIWVTPGFFDVFGTRAALGRAFAAADGPAGGRKVVVLAHAAWEKLFSGDASAIGRTIRISGDAYTVVAVMPRGFSWPLGKGLWVLSPSAVPPSPIPLQDPENNRDVRYFQGIGRLRAGTTLVEAQAELHAIATRVPARAVTRSETRDFVVQPIREQLVGGVRDALLVIQGAVGLVLLIACANVSGLLIARATGRRRELAIRAALGAGRGQLVRHMLTESVTLGVAGGLCGLLLGSWLIVVLQRFVPGGLPRTEIGLDMRVTLVTLGSSLLVGVVFGLLPALQASRARAGEVIKDAGERGTTGRARGRAALVIAEIALTLVLLVGAGLLGTSFLRLTRVDPGFRPEHVMLGNLMVPQARYPKPPQVVSLYRQLVEGLSERGDLQAVGVGFPGPFRGNSAGGSFWIEGRDSPARGERPYANFGTVSGGYFAAMGIPLIAGRTFADTDTDGAPPVAIVSAALARRYFPGENPIGRRIRFDDPKAPGITIVGLVGDVRQLGLRAEPPPLLFFPYQQFALPFTTIVVRSSLPDAAVAGIMRQQLAQINRNLNMGDILPLQTTVDRHVDQPRFRAMLIGAFAVLALILAAVGVYGLISYTVTERTREIGIRVALGAAPRQVLLPVVREGFILAAAGIGIGLAGALAASRALTAFLFGVGAGDPLTFAGVALLLLVVAVTASYIPSRRALRVDPVIALRAE